MSWTTSVGHSGEFERKQSVFRDFISSSPSSRFPPAAHRYHLYVSLACPWAHRTLILKSLKGLDDVIGHTVVDWFLDREVYELSAGGDYSGNVTVPVLFDRTLDVIVNNESSEIVRMLNSEFNSLCATPEQAALDFYPAPLRPLIDDTNSWVYPTINNGVYRSGFAKSQRAYDTAVTELFDSLDRVEAILSKQRYLTSHQHLTEADIRLFTTLIRFDLVYHGHFKCNIRKLSEYPNIFHYMLELYQMPRIRSTVDLLHCKSHYYASHLHINPTGIIPKGPQQDLDQPHNRDQVKFSASA